MPGRRLLVTGWRFYPANRRAVIIDALDGYLDKVWADLDGAQLTVVHGAATGVDSFAHRWATACEHATPEPHPADWATCGPECPGRQHRRRTSRGGYCPDAGMRRNAAMVALGADWILAFPGPDGYRSGTRQCWRLARQAGIGGDLHPWEP